MSKILLFPKTSFGAKILSKHGDVWNLIEEQEIKFILESVNKTFKFGMNFMHGGITVLKNNDPNFSWKYYVNNT